MQLVAYYYFSLTATVNEDYLDVEVNITFTSGQNASGDNQQCFFIPILNDDILECNETFDIFLTPIAEDEDVVNITGQIITVTIEEDPNDCMLISELYIIMKIEKKCKWFSFKFMFFLIFNVWSNSIIMCLIDI